MAKNYVEEGDIITVTAGGTVSSGDGVLIGSIFGVAQGNASSGTDFELAVEGVHDLPKAAGALTQGELVYWDNTAKNVTATATSNTKIGVATQAVTSGGATARVRLNESFG